MFQLDRAETLRRIIRASLDIGPALSAENARTVAALASQVRMVGRNLSQLLHAIHSGDAVPMEAVLPIWEALDERVRAVDAELTAMTIGHGLKLRKAAHLLDGEGA
ncbi:mll9293 (plasmid) [Mesorhizobium japonicum MAFF 303099]|uniref:Mll9293 protein n=1 Tax=Mesorhizobium japonicum (strain LMG 29417 / CECT 9101 / MAFF 303099) TaxID=266835 RepID=Q981P0_RHILO|nr:mll9293 [Mesorhizobium japonicum MAFF 303099]